MKVKEKFLSIELDDPYIFMQEKDAEKCEQIAEDYAIEFADWLLKNDLYSEILLKISTSKELLKIFKKEK